MSDRKKMAKAVETVKPTKMLDLKPAGPTINNLEKEELDKKALLYFQMGNEVNDVYEKMMSLELSRRHLASTIPYAQRQEFLDAITVLRMKDLTGEKELPFSDGQST